jgi:chitinase
VGANLTLSAAVSLTPFTDASRNPSADISGFVQVFDYIILMNYNIWGSWSEHVGPNTPLNDTCALSVNQQGSAISAIKAWTAAGMPVNQIVLGVASYGHSFSVSPSAAFESGTKALAAYPAFNASKQPLGDTWDDTSTVEVCGMSHGPGGTFRFWGLMDSGFLTDKGMPADGIYYRYDKCSQTVRFPSLITYCSSCADFTALQPYLYNETLQITVICS